jgi:hypothetical protein
MIVMFLDYINTILKKKSDYSKVVRRKRITSLNMDYKIRIYKKSGRISLMVIKIVVDIVQVEALFRSILSDLQPFMIVI